MKMSEIEILPILDTVPESKQKLRRLAPRYVASVVNNTRVLQTIQSMDDLKAEYVHALNGGVDAAVYLISTPKERVVIKFGSSGVATKAEAIDAWRKRGVHVPKILGTGIVPLTKDHKQKIYYMIQAVLTDKDGRLVETCAEYLHRRPDQARAVGREMGKELTRLHQSVAGRTFGEFADSDGSASNYQSWNAYILDCFRANSDWLKKNVKLTAAETAAIEKAIAGCKYANHGRYLHGDFSIRNMSVSSYSPLKISVFDPNSLIGDPSWDVSFLINNYEFAKRRLAYDDSEADKANLHKQLWIGFKQGYERRINVRNLLTAQFIQGIYQALYTEIIKDRVGLKVRREFLRDTIDTLCSWH